MNYANSTYPTLKPWAVELLLKWHKQDPVSEKEVNRNNAVYAVQGNRNPYVDYPQLADYVWGDSINYVFHLNGDVESGTGGGFDGGDDNDNNDGNDNSGNTGGDDNGGDDNNEDNDEGGAGNFTSGEFVLVTDAAQLTIGDSIVIGYENFAMGQSAGNYRYKTDMTTSGGVITYLADDAQIVVLEEGVIDDTYAFNVGNGYLAACSSSSNYLKTVSTLDENGSWAITISDGLATITAQGSYARNVLQYNTSSPRFSCYKSGQKDVNIYAKSSVATGVDEMKAESGEVKAIYDLQGRRLNAITEPGIYIVNGKKMLVK